MAQYTEYTAGELVTYTDGVTIFRDGSRGAYFVIDNTLTALGFAGTEFFDWMNIELKTCPSATGVFRDGVRGGFYVIDAAITVTGFAGLENTDWVNLETHT